MDIEDMAARLHRAWHARRQIAPVEELNGADHLPLAYRVQDALLERLQRAGGTVSGGKIGLSNPAMFDTMGVTAPVSGVLFDHFRLASGAVLPASCCCAPRVEGELCLTLNRDLADPDMSLRDAMEAIGSVAPAIEVVDSRWAGTSPRIAGIVAENVSAAWYLLGEPVIPDSVADLEALAQCNLEMSVDGRTVAGGTGSAAFGGPVRALHWLACDLARRGWPLKAGHHVMSGALAPMQPVQAGRHVIADFPGIGRAELWFGKG